LKIVNPEFDETGRFVIKKSSIGFIQQ